MYFIVEATYDDCFKYFFQDELEYPSFYRMSELLGDAEPYQGLILLVPYIHPENDILTKIQGRISELGLKSYGFGKDLETTFTFDPQGQVQIQPLFKQALELAFTEYSKLHTAPPPSASAA